MIEHIFGFEEEDEDCGCEEDCDCDDCEDEE
jgi:hypothetical protein